MTNYDELRQAAKAMAAYDSGDTDLGEDYNYIADLYAAATRHEVILALLDENEALRAEIDFIGKCLMCSHGHKHRHMFGDAS